MKVTHVAPALFGQPAFGGGERYVSELVAAQREAGANCSVVVANRHHKVRTYGIHTTDGGWRAALAAVRTSEIVHVHQLSMASFDVGVALARAAGRPVVVTDLGGGSLTPSRLLGRHRISLVTGTAPLSPFGSADMHGRRVPKKPQRIIWGGGEHVSRHLSARSAGSRDTSRNFLFVGRLLPHKGLHVLLEALPRDASLSVAGRFIDGDYGALIRHLSRGKKVEFIDAPRDAELAELYAASAFTVVPSVSSYGSRTWARSELLALVAIESLACGTPVIGSDIGGLGDLLQLTKQQRVKPGDAVEWRRALEVALQRLPVERPDINEIPNWQSTAELCIELYSEILSK